MSVLLLKLKSLFAENTVEEHNLFLKWLFINTISIAFFVLLGLNGFFRGVHGPPFIAAVVALIVTTGASFYLGKLYWRADIVRQSIKKSKNTLKLPDDYRIETLIHSSERAFYTVGVLQIIGMVGAMLGYRAITDSTDTTNAQQAVHAATQGLGNGLTATIIGVLGSIIIGVLHFEFTHILNKP